MKSGSLNLLEPSGPHWACYGTPLPLPVKYKQSYRQLTTNTTWNYWTAALVNNSESFIIDWIHTSTAASASIISPSYPHLLYIQWNNDVWELMVWFITKYFSLIVKKKKCVVDSQRILQQSDVFAWGGVKLTFSVSSIRIDVGTETVILRVRGDESRLKWLGQPGQRN